ncbi:MAG: cation diffusion facilitator family transporter [Limisphaerales bacterium]
MAINRLQRGLRATFLGMAINALLAAGKLLAGVWGNSHALVADAVESLADIFSAVVVWRSLVLAAKPADEDHPYGHGKAEPIATAIVATMLLLAATGIGLKSVQVMFSPSRGAPAAFTLMVLVGVVVVKEALFRFVLREGTTVGSSAVRSDAWHHRSDAITSLAAAIGISVALVGGKGYESGDDVAAIVAAGIIGWNGWRLMRPAMDELMDTAPNLALIAEIRQTAAAVSGVRNVEKCRVRKVGYHYFVDMHIEVDPQMTVQRGHEIAHRVKDQVRERLPAVHDVLVHVEPAK